MSVPDQLNELGNEEPGFLSVISGHGWNPFDNVAMKDLEFYEATNYKLNIPDWELDSFPTPYEYYKQTIYN